MTKACDAIDRQLLAWNDQGLYVDLIQSPEGWAARLWDYRGVVAYRVAWLSDPAPTIWAAIQRLAEREAATA